VVIPAQTMKIRAMFDKNIYNRTIKNNYCLFKLPALLIIMAAFFIIPGALALAAQDQTDNPPAAGGSAVPPGPGIQIPMPDLFTGEFRYSVPLTIPPGRAGMQPEISLVYNSANANSWLGVGYSLNPGCIVRSGIEDTFRLITNNGTTEIAHVSDNLYRATTETNFAKFYKDKDDTWRVVAKDGGILYFGRSAEAKEKSSRGTYSWHLTRAEDNNSNYIEYTYIKDEGKAYLSRIDYTGNEAANFAPTHSVEFILETREDITSNYISGTRIALNKRLKEVEIRINNALAWYYILEYTYSPETNRSLIQSITQYTVEGMPFPAQEFYYSQ